MTVSFPVLGWWDSIEPTSLELSAGILASARMLRNRLFLEAGEILVRFPSNILGELLLRIFLRSFSNG